MRLTSAQPSTPCPASLDQPARAIWRSWQRGSVMRGGDTILQRGGPSQPLHPRIFRPLYPPCQYGDVAMRSVRHTTSSALSSLPGLGTIRLGTDTRADSLLRTAPDVRLGTMECEQAAAPRTVRPLTANQSPLPPSGKSSVAETGCCALMAVPRQRSLQESGSVSRCMNAPNVLTFHNIENDDPDNLVTSLL